jgi:LmbE family N-acetylglucosaminyl deacetylase
VLDNHDGELEPTLALRLEVIRRIRRWNADMVIAPRPNDYHPDHRNTGLVVQDTAYMVVVPNVAPDTPPLRKNPVYMYAQDHFQRPNPFRPDVAVDIDSVIDRKIQAIDAHVSQFYEWLPWVDGRLDTVPKEPAARLAWLQQWRSFRPLNDDVKAALRKWYGPKGDAVKNAEAFEICEYGRRPSEADLRRLFPFFD